MSKYKLLIITLAAVLTVLVLMVLVRIPTMEAQATKSTIVEENNGVYDLKTVGLENGITAILPPGEYYYPHTYLTSDDTAAPAAGTDKQSALKADYLSQRFIVSLPDENDVYVLSFKLSGPHAFRVYVDGELTGQTGHAATNKQDTHVWENNITCYASPDAQQMEVILHSAQFYRCGRGAGLATLSISRMPLEPTHLLSPK